MAPVGWRRGTVSSASLPEQKKGEGRALRPNPPQKESEYHKEREGKGKTGIIPFKGHPVRLNTKKRGPGQTGRSMRRKEKRRKCFKKLIKERISIASVSDWGEEKGDRHIAPSSGRARNIMQKLKLEGSHFSC